MAIDYSLLALPKNKPSTLVRHTKRVRAKARLRGAYDVVDERDRKICQVTGKHLTADHVDEWRALERDHLNPKSTDPGRRDDPENILTVSRGVHALLQSGSLVPVDRRGQETTSVKRIVGYQWNRRMVAAGKEPFRLKKGKAA